jgi:hypothetical protein
MCARRDWQIAASFHAVRLERLLRDARRVEWRTVIFRLGLACGVLAASLMPALADGPHSSREYSNLLSQVAENNETTYLELHFSYADDKPRQIEAQNIREWHTAGYQEACRDLFAAPATPPRLCPPSTGLDPQGSYVLLLLVFIFFDRKLSARNLSVTVTAAVNEPECATSGSMEVLPS